MIGRLRGAPMAFLSPIIPIAHQDWLSSEQIQMSLRLSAINFTKGFDTPTKLHRDEDTIESQDEPSEAWLVRTGDAPCI